MDSRQGNKGSPRIREALGRLYQEEGPYFQEYLRRFREDPTSRIFAPLAEAYRRMSRLDDAIDICLEGLSHHPDFHGGRVALARCYVDKREFLLAKHELEKIVHVVPENLLAQRLLGDCCIALKETASALQAFRMAQLLSPSDAALAQKVYELEKSIAKASTPLPVPSANDRYLSDPFGDDLDEADDEAEAQAQAEAEAEERFQSVASASPATMAQEADDFFQESPGFEGLPPAPVSPPRQKIVALPPEELVARAKEAADQWPLPPPELMAPLVTPLDQNATEVVMENWDDEDTWGADKVEALLGLDSSVDSESFQIEHVSQIFPSDESGKTPEITTATLGDLYFSQQQFDKALQIFERIAAAKPGPEIEQKIQACRVRLGVDQDALVRMRQIKTLREVLQKMKET